MKRLVALVVGLVLLFGVTGQATADVLYAVSGAGNSPSSLYQINPTTGAATLVGPTGFSHITALSFDPTTGILYGHQSFNAGAQNLVTINPATGAATLVGPTGNQVPDFTFNAAGTLYAWTEFDISFSIFDQLITIDTATGAATPIGTFNVGTALTGLAFDQNGTLWLKPFNELYTVDPTTGVATFATFLDTILNNALAFDSSNTAFSILRSGNTSFLTTLDTTTGQVTTIGDTGIAGLSALAFVPQQVVPEPATIAVFGLMAAGAFGLRRRKSAT